MQRPWCIVAVVALLAAGCIASDPSPSGDAGDLPLPLADVITIVDPTGGVGEPSLGVEPDGTLWTTGDAPLVPTGQGYRLVGYRSGDGGRTWQMVDAGIRTLDLDPDLAVSRDGTVWLDSLWLGCSTAASSQDSGATWTTNDLACVPVGGDRQYLVPTEGGTAYISNHQRPTYQQAVAKTTDYGRTWIPLGLAEPATPAHFRFANEGSGWGGGGFWNAVTGSVFLTYTWFEVDVTGTTTGWSPAFSVSRDEGRTWEVTRITHAGGEDVGLGLVVGAVDAAGNVYLAWAESHDEGRDMAIYLASSDDDGRTWGAPQRVDDGTGSKLWPAIAAGADGKVAVAYYETDEDAYPANVSMDAAWTVTLAWTADALAETAAWERGTLSQTTVHHGTMCPDGFACQSGDELRDYFALEALADGRVASVWTSTEDVPGTIVNVFGSTREALLR